MLLDVHTGPELLVLLRLHVLLTLLEILLIVLFKKILLDYNVSHCLVVQLLVQHQLIAKQ
jgi:hypothetical protein